MKRLFLVLLLLAAPAAADIVLTVPEAVRSEIGGSGTVNYDRIRTLNISVDPQANVMEAQIEIYASSDNAQPAYRGTYSVDADAQTARLEIPSLGFQTGLTLTPAQATTVINAIDDHRDNIENSMIAFGVVAGTQQ